MKSTVWGPSLWQFFDAIAFHNEEKGKTTIEFLKLFRWLLPCRYCRESFQVFVQEVPESLRPTDYVYAIHTRVNQKLEKPNLTYTTYVERLKVFQAPISDVNVRNLCLLLVANYDNNTAPEQQKAFVSFWRQLPDMLSKPLPKLAATLRQCRDAVPENRPLSTKLLQDRLSCSFRDLQRVALIRS